MHEGLRQSGYFQVPFKGTGLYAPGLLAGGAGAPYKRFRRRRKPWRRGGFAAPSIEIPEGGGRLRRPEPKKKDMTKGHVFLFGKSLQSRYFKFSIGFPHLAQRPFWAAPLLRRSSVLPKAKPRRRANSLRPSNLKNPRYPKKKHLLCRCFFFGIPQQSRYFRTPKYEMSQAF